MTKSSTQNELLIRRAAERGHADHGWLDAWHSFSFADYYDPEHMGYRALRVINDDTVAPGKGFGTHPHRSMEIFTYVKEGTLRHEDSMGNGRDIKAGEFQYMSAGTGVLHSEVNPSEDTPVKLYQVWITPDHPGGEPRYQDFDLSTVPRADGMALLASADGRDGSISIRQNAEVLHGRLVAGTAHTLPENTALPYTWLQMIDGSVTIEGETLEASDAVAFDHRSATLNTVNDASFLLFRLS